MGSLDGIAAGAARTIGGYFNVVSLVPSALLVVWVYLLAATGAPTHAPDWNAAVSSLLALGWPELLGMLAVSVAVGLALHPLQFTLVQLYEGYWGVSRTAVALRAARVRHHQARRRGYQEAFERVGATAHPTDLERVEQAESQRLLDYLPRSPDWVMPTRLGNVLRHYETAIGASYGLDAPRVLPHLALVAPPSHLEYLNDQRTLLDLAVRLSFVNFMGSIAAVVFLWPVGLWALVALVPYGLAYLFYRGAVVAASSYGIAMGAVVDLNRFALYERLHLALPADTKRERQANAVLEKVLNFDPTVVMPLEKSGRQGSVEHDPHA